MKKRSLLIIFAAVLILNSCKKINNSDNDMTAAAEGGIIYSTNTEEKIPVTAAFETKEPAMETKTADSSVNDELNDEQFNSVLENIAFVGDSVTLGYGAYQKVKMEDVIAAPCVGPSNIRDFTFEYRSEKLAALTILSYKNPEYIVISMGLNDINTYSPENFSDKYMDFTEDVMKVCPESEIYIMSITPVSADCGNIANDTIISANNQLKITVENYKNEKLHYVDCSSVLKDESGNMNTEYSGGDGIHLNSAAYDLMLDQLRRSIS